MEEEKMIPNVGGQEAGYLFEFKPDGVFLTVYPSDGGILFELSDMRQVLKEYGVIDYDIEVLARTLREAAGKSQKLADHFEAPVDWPKEEGTSENKDGKPAEEKKEYAKFTIEITKDRMKAIVHIDYKAGNLKPDMDMIMEALQSKKVVFGIDSQAIETGLEDGAEDFIAAQGIPAINGADARIERKFNLNIKGRPALSKYDQADYKNLNLVVLVKKGEILAERILQTAGTSGTNVFGDEVMARHGKPKPLPSGKNTIVKDENSIFADIDGQIVDTGSKISVDPLLSISGDVGVSTGNIDFTGAVHVSGNVQAGFVIKAAGDIEVKGMVSGATLEGQNVFISGGVQGMNRGKIIAHGDVRASFAENADIQSDGNIYITDVSLHSQLQAGKKLIVEGKRGQVTGGTLAAGEEIRAKVIGNFMNVSTRLSVGVNPMLQKKYQDTCKEYADCKKRLSQLTKTLNTLGKIDMSRLPPERLEQINSLTRSQFPLAGLVERDEKIIRDLEIEMQNIKKGKIRVLDTIFPGVKLKVNSAMKNIQTEQKHCTFYVEEDVVKTGPY
jgi:uncharacterized protein